MTVTELLTEQQESVFVEPGFDDFKGLATEVVEGVRSPQFNVWDVGSEVVRDSLQGAGGLVMLSLRALANIKKV